MQLPSTAKEIEGFPGYWVTPGGEVWSTGRHGRNQPSGPMKLSACIGKIGYRTFCIYSNNKINRLYVHRIIAQAFIQNPNNFPLVCHRNDIKTDNRIENLYWGTHSNNRVDACNNGHWKPTSRKGEQSSSAKLKEIDVLNIRALNSHGFRQGYIAKMYGISQPHVSSICVRRTWRHIA